jgi:hypothetical protein
MAELEPCDFTLVQMNVWPAPVNGFKEPVET